VAPVWLRGTGGFGQHGTAKCFCRASGVPLRCGTYNLGAAVGSFDE